MEENKTQPSRGNGRTDSHREAVDNDKQKFNSTRSIQQATIKKLSFKEKTEFEKLENEIPALEKEKKLLEVKMNNGSMDYEKLQAAAERVNEIIVLLDQKEMRWLELSEKE